jgi:hypothetical protein
MKADCIRCSFRGPDGHVRRVSGAYFYMAVSLEGGAYMPLFEPDLLLTIHLGLIVQNSLGPRQSADIVYNNFQDYELPEMKALSDMMCAMWEYYIPASGRQNINFMMSLAITNPRTLAIIRCALDSAGQTLSTTLYRFEMATDGALAILGMPKSFSLVQISGINDLKVPRMAHVLRTS